MFSLCLNDARLSLAEYVKTVFGSESKDEHFAAGYVHVLRNTQNLVILRCRFAEKKYAVLKRTSTCAATFCFATFSLSLPP